MPNCCEAPCRAARMKPYPLANTEKVIIPQCSSASLLAHLISLLPVYTSRFSRGDRRIIWISIPLLFARWILTSTTDKCWLSFLCLPSSSSSFPTLHKCSLISMCVADSTVKQELNDIKALRQNAFDSILLSCLAPDTQTVWGVKLILENSVYPHHFSICFNIQHMHQILL